MLFRSHLACELGLVLRHQLATLCGSTPHDDFRLGLIQVVRLTCHRRLVFHGLDFDAQLFGYILERRELGGVVVYLNEPLDR